MTTLREAAQQALEALAVATNCLDGYYIPRGKTTLPEIEDAITALKAALAEKALHIDTLRMALESGFGCDTDGHIFTDSHDGVCDEYLERFAALVAAAEREACAKVCDVTPPYPFRPSIEAAHAIRARSNT